MPTTAENHLDAVAQLRQASFQLVEADRCIGEDDLKGKAIIEGVIEELDFAIAELERMASDNGDDDK